MEDIPNFILYIILTILIVISILYILKYKYHWTFKVSIGRTGDEFIKSEKKEGFEDMKEEEKESQNEVVEDVEGIIETVKPKETETKTNVIINENKTLEELIEEKVQERLQEKIEEQMNKVITRNNGEIIARNKYNTYDVMLNEPVGRLKQSRLMIDQIVNKNLERYYAYVKPIAIEDGQKDAYNANTFCIKCDSKDADYSGYFLSDPLEYQNDKLEGNGETGITAYNI